ncbi:MAG: orotidine 5'-phosphate decarboxylase [Planctomycetota bacterium]|nr:orotidine 5'-phosphate decarboxylase [Planctomycetota bacterium]
MSVTLQLALDLLDLERALRIAAEAVPQGADWVEAGTPLIKSEGLSAVRVLREKFPDKKIVADMKTADAGRIEMEAAAKAGADYAIVLATASESTIRECIEVGRNYGLGIGVDLLGATEPERLVEQMADWGLAFVSVHCPIDVQMRGGDPFELLARLAKATQIPLAAAGGLNSETAPRAAATGASIVVIGGAITKAECPGRATADIRKALDTGQAVKTELFRRASLENVREVLLRVSTANLSDAAHHRPCIMDLAQITPGAKLVGPVLTVRTAPGDFAKPVEAIDHAEAGQVIAIDAGGSPPAVWGELATESATQKKVAGVVIDGAIRDADEIRRLAFPAHARHVCSHAGYPKGFGEIGGPIRLAGVEVMPGDWIVGDADGLMVLAKEKVVELANRAQDVLEAENRMRAEIREGRTLGQVAYLQKWEKQR